MATKVRVAVKDLQVPEGQTGTEQAPEAPKQTRIRRTGAERVQHIADTLIDKEIERIDKRIAKLQAEREELVALQA